MRDTEEVRYLKRVIDAYVDMLVEYTSKGEGELIGEMSKRVEERENLISDLEKEDRKNRYIEETEESITCGECGNWEVTHFGLCVDCFYGIQTS